MPPSAEADWQVILDTLKLDTVTRVLQEITHAGVTQTRMAIQHTVENAGSINQHHFAA
jgi:hypothetical protein